MARIVPSLIVLAFLSWSAASAQAEPDSIVAVARSGSAPAVSMVLEVGGRRSLVEGCTGGGCGECTDAACSWGVTAGSEATLTVSGAQGFVETIAADCIGGLQRGEIVPGIAEASCTFRARSGTMPISVVVNRPTIRLRVEGPTTAVVFNPNRATDPIILTVTTGSGTVEVDRGDHVSFRQSPLPNVAGRVVLGGFSGDCVSAEPWCNLVIDKPQVAVTAKASIGPLLP